MNEKAPCNRQAQRTAYVGAVLSRRPDIRHPEEPYGSGDASGLSAMAKTGARTARQSLHDQQGDARAEVRGLY